MTSLEALGYALLGGGISAMTAGLYHGFFRLRAYLRKRKFDAFVSRLQRSVQDAVVERPKKKGREISELTFRDKSGAMTTVRIVVDHDMMDEMSEEDKQRLRGAILSGKQSPGLGTLDGILSGHAIEESAMGKVQEFVFSPKAVQDMRNAGLEPDEVVTKMLRASGRML